MYSSWVYELQDGDVGEIYIKRIQHQTTELRKSSLSDENRRWARFLSHCIVMTSTQITVDWFLMRICWFASTTLHVILNIRNTIYLHEHNIKLIHAACKNIVMVCPIADITLDNSLTGSDSDVGDLRR